MQSLLTGSDNSLQRDESVQLGIAIAVLYSVDVKSLFYNVVLL